MGGAASEQAGSAPVSPEPEKPAVVDRDTFAQFERETARVFDYCRALVGRDDLAASATEAALSSARSMVQDPDLLRAWLFALARRQALATDVSGADSREVFELVYRHGIRREDLGAVLGVPAEEAAALLAAAEAEFGRPEPLVEQDPAEEAPGRVDVPPSQQRLLQDQDQLRAWLFALARQQALTSGSGSTAGQAARAAESPGLTVADFVAPNPEPTPASRWRRSVGRVRLAGRRRRIAAVTAMSLAAAAGLAVYLGGISHPVGSRAPAGTGGATLGPVGLPRPAQPNARPAVPAPHASPSSAVPISVMFPAVPPPVVEPPPPSPWPTSPSPTPKPSPKPSPTPSPKPSPTPSTKPSPTPSPKSSPKPTTPTPKPSG
jgi:hypothetical protein